MERECKYTDFVQIGKIKFNDTILFIFLTKKTSQNRKEGVTHVTPS